MAVSEEIGVRIVGNSSAAEAAAAAAGEAIKAAVSTTKTAFVGVAASARESMGLVGTSVEEAAVKTEHASGVAEVAATRWKLSMTGIGERAKHLRHEVIEQYDFMEKAIGRLNKAFAGLMLVMAGGEMFREAISAATEFDTHTLKLSKTLGITLEAASGLHVALHELGIGTDTYTGAALRLSRQLRMHEDQLNAIGVVTREYANGPLLNMQQIMANTLDTLRNTAEGTSRNIAAQVAFGRGAGDLTQLLRLNKEALEEGGETAKKLGLILGTDGVQALVDYKKATQSANMTLHAVTISIGRALLPILTRLGDRFVENGPIIMDVVHGIGVGFDWTYQIIHVGALTIMSTLEAMKIVVIGVINVIKTLGTVMLDVMSGSWGRIEADWSAGWAKVEADAVGAARRIKQVWIDAANASQAGPKPTKFNDPTTGAGNTIDPEDLKRTKAPKKKKSDTGEDDFAKQIEEAQRFANKVAAIYERLAQQNIAATAVEAKGREKAQLDAVDAAGAAAKHEAAMGRITAEQLLAIEADLEARRYVIKRQALSDELALERDGPRDPVKMARINEGLLQLEREYQAKRAKLAMDVETQMAKRRAESVKGWTKDIAQLSSVWGQSLAKMATMQASFGTTLQSMWQGLVGTIESAIAKMVESWIIGLFTKEAASKSFHMKEVLQTAKQAAAHAYNAVVGIPVVGPFLAPPAAALAFAGVVAFSAEGGYDIPAGINPVTQLHQREMVLPAKQADVIRNMADGGGGRMGDVHLHVHATDAQSVKRLFMDNKGYLAAAVKSAMRDGAR